MSEQELNKTISKVRVPTLDKTLLKPLILEAFKEDRSILEDAVKSLKDEIERKNRVNNRYLIVASVLVGALATVLIGYFQLHTDYVKQEAKKYSLLQEKKLNETLKNLPKPQYKVS